NHMRPCGPHESQHGTQHGLQVCWPHAPPIAGTDGAIAALPGPVGMAAAPWPAAGGVVGLTGGGAGAGCMLIGRPTGIRGTTILGNSGMSDVSASAMSMALAVV